MHFNLSDSLKAKLIQLYGLDFRRIFQNKQKQFFLLFSSSSFFLAKKVLFSKNMYRKPNMHTYQQEFWNFIQHGSVKGQVYF